MLVIRHEPYEAIAGFRQPIEARGYAIAEVDVASPDFVAIDLLEPDLLVLMGGPMGVYEQERHPWLGPEIVRVCGRIAADRPTLGVCLGSQVMAAAMGSPVYPGPAKELGFHPVDLTAEGLRTPLAHVRAVPMLHWHGDSFDLPEHATRLASTSLYANQAFARGANILALQFHPEMGEDPSFDTWCESGAAFIAAAGVDPEALLESYDLHGPACVDAGRRLVADWLAGLDD